MSDLPKAGEWWEESEGQRLYCVGKELGGWPVVQRNNGCVYSTLGPAWKGRKLDGCTGWDWEPGRLEDLLTVNILQDKIDDLENVVQMLRVLKNVIGKK